MPRRLDRKDERILHALSLDARQSLSGVGRKAGLSVEVVNYRLQRLVRLGIVQKFRAEISPFKLGCKEHRFYVRLEGADIKKEEEMFHCLAGIGGAEWVSECEGRYNFIFGFMSSDEFEMNRKIGLFLEKFSENIKENDIAIPLEWNFYPAQSGVYEPGKPKYRLPAEVGPARLDGTDLRLLRILSDDARASGTKIASGLGVGPKTVRCRIRRLEKEGVIRGYRVFVNRSLLGMCHHKVLVRFRGAPEERIEKFVRHCEALPNLVFLVRSVGAWDMEIDFDFRNPEELHRSLMEIAGKFSDLIAGYETLLVVKNTYCNPIRGMKR